MNASDFITWLNTIGTDIQMVLGWITANLHTFLDLLRSAQSFADVLQHILGQIPA